MVGVPRSKGCDQCRKLKKGCNLARPACGRCTRVGVPCSYSGRQWTFVEQTASEGPSSGIVLRGQRATVNTKTREILRRTASTPTSDSERHLRRTDFEQQNMGEFWELFLPKEDPDTIYVGGMQITPWEESYLELYHGYEDVKLAFQACALLLRSRAHEDPKLGHAAVRLYVQALSKTNRALQDPQTAQSDSVLAACRALAHYELMRGNVNERLSSQANDWLKHVEGTCRIVQLRGPERHVSSHGKTLFEKCRSAAVLAGIAMRKPNSFTDMVWHNVPWQQSPRELRDALFDIMMILPDLLHKQDSLLETVESATSMSERYSALVAARDHLSRCTQIADSLQQWENRVVQTCLDEAGSLYEQEVGPIDLFAVRNNHGFAFFHMIMQYWTALTLVYASSWIAYRKVTVQLQPDEPLSLPAWIKPPKPHDWMNPTIPASNIVKSAGKYFTAEAGYWGSQTSSWSLGFALHYYSSIGMVDSDEMNYLRGLIHIPKYGKMAAQWLRSMANLNTSTKYDPGDRPTYEAVASRWFGTDKIGISGYMRSVTPWEPTEHKAVGSPQFEPVAS